MTRISSIATYSISVPRPEPVWTAHEELKAWSVILVAIKTDDGLTGYGEIHGAPIPRICDWVARFAEIVHGMDALAHEAVWARLFALTSPRAGVIEGKDGLPPPVPRSERAGAVRAAIGEQPELMLDMNAPYDLPECIEFAHRVEPHRIFWLEEPLHWYLQPADFARLAAATPIALAHGERELTRFTVRDFIVQGGIRYVQFDATRAAGFTEALRIAALAEQHGVMAAPHSAPEIHGHLVLGLPRCAFGVESHGRAESDPLAFGLFQEHPELRDGHLHFGVLL